MPLLKTYFSTTLDGQSLFQYNTIATTLLSSSTAERPAVNR
jgi:hypothetical protein